MRINRFSPGDMLALRVAKDTEEPTQKVQKSLDLQMFTHN